MAEGLSPETIDHSIDEILSAAYFELQKVLWDNTLPIQERIRCIRSMYRVYADFVATTKEVMGTCFYMWWDFVCTAFWFEQSYERKLPSETYVLLGEEDRRLVDAMFETLVVILKLNNDTTNSCALHGLRHLHHPGVHAVVQEHIDSHSSGLDPNSMKWLEECRDGKVMSRSLRMRPGSRRREKTHTPVLMNQTA